MNLRARLKRLEQIGGCLFEVSVAPDVPSFAGLSPVNALRRFDAFRLRLAAMRFRQPGKSQPAERTEAMAAFVVMRDAINTTHGASQ